MRIHLYSDLHLDHDEDEGFAYLSQGLANEDQADIAVVAGDLYSVGDARRLVFTLSQFAHSYTDVIFVPGNHDFWQTNPDDLLFEVENQRLLLDDTDYDRIHMAMTPQVLKVQGQNFLCGTMWYPKPQRDEIQDFVDMYRIRKGLQWIFDEFSDFYDLLMNTEVQDSIVVTHHLPSNFSTPDKFKGSPTNHFFMTDMSKAIAFKRPKLWLHGHTHDACEYKLFDTRVICNPRGYPFEYKARAEYKPKLIEV